MSPALVTIIMFGTAVALMVLGLPIAFALGGTATIVGFLLWGPNCLSMFVSIIKTQMTSFVVVALPGFVFMAVMLEYSGLADRLFQMIHMWMGNVRGGLAMGTVVISAIFAAMCGISAAATLTMGTLALPAMFKRKYDTRLAIGAVSAGGALGILIPPSVIFILYGEFVGVSVGKLFMGGVFPGILLAILLIIYIGVRAFLQPQLAPAIPPDERGNFRQKVVSLKATILPAILIIVVLGVIFLGVCTPSEAAAIGAAGAIACCAVYRRLSWEVIKMATLRTIGLVAMVMWIMLGAKCFTNIYTGLGASSFMQEMVLGLPLGPYGILILMQLTFFVLGMFLDPVGIVAICAPVYVPIAVALGFDPVWYGVLFVINMEMAYITPPFGFNLFYMKGVVPEGVSMGDIYRSVPPYVAVQAVSLAIVMLFPKLALWLPSIMIGE